MECPGSPFPGNQEFIRQFNNRTTRLRVPLTGSLDLTSRCNLNCVHCYLGPHPVSSGSELSAERWFSLIDEVADAGCLYLLITGGEPLLRRDFAEIYRYIREKGIIPTVFTNGTLITPEIVRLFAEYPPQAVEISLYGATLETYERVTGVAGSFDKCISGIRRLLDSKTEVRIKTILMTLNSHEFYAIEDMARRWGLKFRFDASIFPRLSGDKSPLELRVQAGEVVEKEFSDPERLRSWAEFGERFSGVSHPDLLYTCGAGVTNFHIDSSGSLRPCILTSGPACDLEVMSFAAGWNNVIPKIRDKRPASGFACSRCERWAFCSFCPAFFGLENGAEDVLSEYLCSIGTQRCREICYNSIGTR